MKKSYLIGVLGIVVLLIGGIYLFGNDIPQDNQVNEVEEVLSYMDVSAIEAKSLIENNPEIIVIDVSPHYDEGHLPGAINYYPSSVLLEAIPTLDKNAMYLKAGGEQTRFVLMGEGLDQINSSSVVNPKGVLDKNIIVKHGGKASASQKTIYLSATSKARIGAGYYRLRLHVNNRTLTIHPGKIRISITNCHNII